MSAQDYLEGSEVEDYTGMSSDLEDDVTWVEWFCTVKGHEYFVEIDEDYIRDDFNLTGLSADVKHYDRALNIILDEASDEEEEDEEDEDNVLNSDGEPASPSRSIVAAQTLYGLIHARYIITHRGLSAMLDKYNNFIFGTCPNVFCNNQPVVPVGLSDTLGESRANVFCPRCNEVYYPRCSRLASIDGAFFGSTFPHMFFLQHDHLIMSTPLQYYVPKVYGFSIWRGVKDMLRVEAGKSSQSQKTTTRANSKNRLRSN